MTACELLARRSPADIGVALEDDSLIVYRDNGNRTSNAEATLERARPLLPLMGITRVAEISALSSFSYPVVQTIRPNLMFHRAVGQNTGSQGKGPTLLQARISAIMESVEAYCAEPRMPAPLFRGTFSELRRQHVVLDPCQLQSYSHTEPSSPSEALLWTDAWSPELDAPVLVPAETVFFPILAGDYATRALFPSGTNGLASGGSYLDAVVHGLYEVIERHCCHELAKGRIALERFHLQGLIDLAEHASLAPDFAIRIYAARLPAPRTLPMISCVVTDKSTGASAVGHGCAANVALALSRAVSEAWQSAATVVSGGREDMASKRRVAFTFPAEPSLHVAEYRRSVVDERFDSVREEYDFIVHWLKISGFQHVLIANLTRVGIDIPVVKVIVPGMKWLAADRPAAELERTFTSADVSRIRHGVRPVRAAKPAVAT
jgi:YcaO-like protein with predicted kinase domain